MKGWEDSRKDPDTFGKAGRLHAGVDQRGSGALLMNAAQILITIVGLVIAVVTFCLLRFPHTRRPQFRQYGRSLLPRRSWALPSSSPFVCCWPTFKASGLVDSFASVLGEA